MYGMFRAKGFSLIGFIFQLLKLKEARKYPDCGILWKKVYGNWNDNVAISRGFVMRDIEFIDS